MVVLWIIMIPFLEIVIFILKCKEKFEDNFALFIGY
jgi:hypothetical protein